MILNFPTYKSPLIATQAEVPNPSLIKVVMRKPAKVVKKDSWPYELDQIYTIEMSYTQPTPGFETHQFELPAKRFAHRNKLLYLLGVFASTELCDKAVINNELNWEWSSDFYTPTNTERHELIEFWRDYIWQYKIGNFALILRRKEEPQMNDYYRLPQVPYEEYPVTINFGYRRIEDFRNVICEKSRLNRLVLPKTKTSDFSKTLRRVYPCLVEAVGAALFHNCDLYLADAGYDCNYIDVVTVMNHPTVMYTKMYDQSQYLANKFNQLMRIWDIPLVLSSATQVFDQLQTLKKLKLGSCGIEYQDMLPLGPYFPQKFKSKPVYRTMGCSWVNFD